MNSVYPQSNMPQAGHQYDGVAERRYKVIAAVITTALMALLLIVCLAFGYMPPDPPIPESGVEVNLGFSDMGQGDIESPADGGNPVPATPSNSSEDVATQSTEESVALPSKATERPVQRQPQEKPQPNVKPQQEKPHEPVINSNALFPGNRRNNSNTPAGNQGNTTGQGNMGRADGNPNASGYSGHGGGGNGGASYSLVGRVAQSLPEPSYNSNAQGKIVITIHVDRQGNVVSAENSRGTTINDQNLVSLALAAARKAKFSASETAAEKQKGTITYIFSRSN